MSECFFFFIFNLWERKRESHPVGTDLFWTANGLVGWLVAGFVELRFPACYTPLHSGGGGGGGWGAEGRRLCACVFVRVCIWRDGEKAVWIEWWCVLRCIERERSIERTVLGASYLSGSGNARTSSLALFTASPLSLETYI